MREVVKAKFICLLLAIFCFAQHVQAADRTDNWIISGAIAALGDSDERTKLLALEALSVRSNMDVINLEETHLDSIEDLLKRSSPATRSAILQALRSDGLADYSYDIALKYMIEYEGWREYDQLQSSFGRNFIARLLSKESRRRKLFSAIPKETLCQLRQTVVRATKIDQKQKKNLLSAIKKEEDSRDYTCSNDFARKLLSNLNVALKKNLSLGEKNNIPNVSDAHVSSEVREILKKIRKRESIERQELDELKELLEFSNSSNVLLKKIEKGAKLEPKEADQLIQETNVHAPLAAIVQKIRVKEEEINEEDLETLLNSNLNYKNAALKVLTNIVGGVSNNREISDEEASEMLLEVAKNERDPDLIREILNKLTQFSVGNHIGHAELYDFIETAKSPKVAIWAAERLKKKTGDRWTKHYIDRLLSEQGGETKLFAQWGFEKLERDLITAAMNKDVFEKIVSRDIIIDLEAIVYYEMLHLRNKQEANFKDENVKSFRVKGGREEYFSEFYKIWKQSSSTSHGQYHYGDFLGETFRVISNESQSKLFSGTFLKLLALGPLTSEELTSLLQLIDDNPKYASELRFMTYVLAGGRTEISSVLKYVGRPPKAHGNDRPSIDDLAALIAYWPSNGKDWPIEQEFAEQAVWIAKEIDTKESHLATLEKLKLKLEGAFGQKSQEIEGIIRGWEEQRLISSLLKNTSIGVLSFISAHFIFWVSLIFFYPRSRSIQSIFFWNPRVRKFGGLFYIEVLVLIVPALRRRLFEPFRKELVAHANLADFNERDYFEECYVKEKREDNSSGQNLLLSEVLSNVHGQIILEGEGGLGKTWYLRHLLKSNAHQLFVYLPAFICAEASEDGASEGGDVVLLAIQERLEGIAKDRKYLKSLLHAGALNIAIDGVNEVEISVRKSITRFMESNSKANIIVTTQPVRWREPNVASMRKFVLQPLSDKERMNFLISRPCADASESELRGAKFVAACNRFLESTLSRSLDTEDRKTREAVLSNPLDLTLVAEMISRGNEPNLSDLIGQSYRKMSDDYFKQEHKEFPLQFISHEAFRRQLQGGVLKQVEQDVADDQDTQNSSVLSIPLGDLKPAIEKMEEYHLVVKRGSVEAKTDGRNIPEFRFRHDKIREWFILQYLLEVDRRTYVDIIAHESFDSVIIQLIDKLDLEKAEILFREVSKIPEDRRATELVARCSRRFFQRRDKALRIAV